MEIFTVIKELLIALFWPLVVLYAIFVFKSELQSVVKRFSSIDKLKFKDFSAEFTDKEINKIKESSKAITNKLVNESDSEFANKVEGYISEYALVEKLKNILLDYLSQYGVVNIDTARVLFLSSVKDENKTSKYLEIIVDLLTKEKLIRKQDNLLVKNN